MNGGAADATGLECVCVGGFQGINCQDGKNLSLG